MNDLIKERASDPSCLLAITPEAGGSWLAPFRTRQPRDFAANPMPWTDAKTALDKIDQSHDFTFEIEFKCVETNAVYVFASDASRDFIRVFMSAGQVIVNSALMSTSPGGSTQFSAGSDSTNRHALTVKMIKNTITALIDGEIVYTRENLVRNAIEISAPRSNAGYVYKISITDDTTGEIVWQAAYSDLYDTSNPWPSSVPRDFNAEPTTFTDSYTAQDRIGTDDFTLSVDFTLLRENVHGTISIGCMRCIYYDSTKGHQPCVWILKSDGTKDALYLVGTSHMTEDVASIKVIKTGQNVRMVVYASDGSVVRDHTNPLPDGATVTSSSGATTYPGNIFAASIHNDTTGRTVWSPPEAERVRLITKTNVRTDRGAFEAANETQPARVETALDLRGKVSSYTVVVDFEAITPDGTQSKMELAGQGASVAAGFPSICALAQSGTAGNIQLSQEINGIRKIVYKAPINQLGRHVAVGVVDVGNSSTRLAVYYDGDLLVEDTFDGIPAGTCDSRATNYALFDNRNGAYTMHYGKIYSALLFDRALSAAEIAALTPKKQPLSWAGIRDVVRRGRAQRYFAVGDVLTIATPRWTIEYEVTGFDQVEPADAALTHSMTLLPVRLVTNLQFDAPEPGNPIMDRPRYGCNRWDWSSIRQWLNSAAAPGEWWTAQHEYDAAPAYAATLAGFMADLPADFLSAVAPARLVTALPNADGGGGVETIDRFWLPSRTEIFGALNGGIAEGVQMAKYIDATDADRIKQDGNGAAARWRLRSANLSQAHSVYLVSSDGTFFVAGHGAAVGMGIVPACIIA